MKLSALGSLIGARVLGDGSIELWRVRDVGEAGPGDLTFAHAAPERRAAFCTRASAVLVEESFAADHAHELPCAVLAGGPALLAQAIEALHPHADVPAVIDAHAVIDPRARFEDDVGVGPFAVVGACVVGRGSRIAPLAYVGDDVILGHDVRVGVGAVVLAGTTVGDRCVIAPGAVLGDDGFVHAPTATARDVRLRHLARVHLGDDVDVGANACVDRGLLRDTRVGHRTRIDNLVQVAHDVSIGDDVVVVAQVGIAGRAEIGTGAVLGGQAGVNPFVRIAPHARVGGQAGVTHDVLQEGAAVSGFPAYAHLDWLKDTAASRRLQHRLSDLEERLRALESRSTSGGHHD